MKIIIKGNRNEGKTKLAEILLRLLSAFPYKLDYDTGVRYKNELMLKRLKEPFTDKLDIVDLMIEDKDGNG